MSTLTWTLMTTAPSSSGCPCSIWFATATTAVTADPDSAATKVGVSFWATQAGTITGTRLLETAVSAGTRTGSLWTKTETRLGVVTSGGVTAGGWQQATVASPIAVTAGTTDAASSVAPDGHHSVNKSYFTAATRCGPSTALRNTTGGASDVCACGTTSNTIPSSSCKPSTNWVDVVLATS